jgi:predicted nucleotidyltransferase
VTLVADIPLQLAPYLDRLVATLRETTDLEAAYLIGSAARGAYEHGRSDVDVTAVTARPLPLAERQAVARAAEAIPCPARKLELVVYALGSDRWEINLNTGEHVSFDPSGEEPFWFVLDRAIAQQDVVVLFGPPWEELFEPISRKAVLDSLEQALDWQEREEPVGRSAVLNAVRSWQWVETGRWASKQDAAAWLRERVRAAIREAR